MTYLGLCAFLAVAACDSNSSSHGGAVGHGQVQQQQQTPAPSPIPQVDSNDPQKDGQDKTKAVDSKPAKKPLEIEQITETGCLDQAIVDDVMADFDFQNKGALESMKVKLCDEKDLFTRVIRGLIILKYGRYDEPKKSTDDLYMGEFTTTATPYDFVKKRISHIVFMNSTSAPELGITAGGVAFTQKGKDSFYFVIDAIQSMEQDNGGQFPPSFFAATTVHESRHTDADDKGHVACERGQFEGLESCDVSRAQRGGYGFGVEYMVLVAKYGKNFSKDIKDYMRGQAVFQMQSNFNQTPHIEDPDFSLKDR
jgi:hypothetical protein